MVACNRKRLKINSKTIHCSSTRLTCKKEKPPVRGFGLTGTRAKYLCFRFRYGIMVFLTIESANKAEINILSARDTTRPGP